MLGCSSPGWWWGGLPGLQPLPDSPSVARSAREKALQESAGNLTGAGTGQGCVRGCLCISRVGCVLEKGAVCVTPVGGRVACWRRGAGPEEEPEGMRLPPPGAGPGRAARPPSPPPSPASPGRPGVRANERGEEGAGSGARGAAAHGAPAAAPAPSSRPWSRLVSGHVPRPRPLLAARSPEE